MELFPAALIRTTWSEIKGSKSDICSGVAAGRAPEDLLAFVAQHFRVCKQHVYILGRSDKSALPTELLGATGYFPTADRGIYIVRTTFTTLLRDPAEETTIDFLWPMAIEQRDKYFVARLVSLEKEFGVLF